MIPVRSNGADDYRTLALTIQFNEDIQLTGYLLLKYQNIREYKISCLHTLNDALGSENEERRRMLFF